MVEFAVKGTKPKDHKFPIISWGIRLLTWAKISHVLLDFARENTVFHVYFNDGRFEPRTKYLKSTTVEYNIRIQTNAKRYDDIMRSCERRTSIQKGYYFHLLGITLCLPFRLFKVKVRNPFAEMNKSRTCSQMIAEIFLENGQLKEAIEALPVHLTNITEMDIINILLENQGIQGEFNIIVTNH